MNLSINHEPKYAIVDEDNNILETFRIRTTPHSMFHYYKEKYFPINIKIIKLTTKK
jgi:hypothetical protein